MTEIWKDVVGYEGLYEVSNLGRVKSLIKRYKNVEFLSQFLRSKDGYLHVNLCKNNIRKLTAVHRIVANAFLGNSDKVVDHIDGCKTNNCIDNLRYCSSRENVHFYHKSMNRTVGVRYRADRDAWISMIYVNGKSEYLGYFKDKSKAELAFKKRLNDLQVSTF